MGKFSTKGCRRPASHIGRPQASSFRRDTVPRFQLPSSIIYWAGRRPWKTGILEVSYFITDIDHPSHDFLDSTRVRFPFDTSAPTYIPKTPIQHPSLSVRLPAVLDERDKGFGDEGIIPMKYNDRVYMRRFKASSFDTSTISAF